MLEPREADIPALFLVLVVLPLVAYILLGKWSEATKKRERISLLAHLAAEEALRAEAMAVADVIPLAAPIKNVPFTKNVGSTKNGFHACARCFGLATTRCSRCKSVRYWYGLILILCCNVTECFFYIILVPLNALNFFVFVSFSCHIRFPLALYTSGTTQSITSFLSSFTFVTCFQFWEVSNTSLEGSSQARMPAD